MVEDKESRAQKMFFPSMISRSKRSARSDQDSVHQEGKPCDFNSRFGSFERSNSSLRRIVPANTSAENLRYETSRNARMATLEKEAKQRRGTLSSKLNLLVHHSS